MTAVDALKWLKQFMVDEVATTITLQKEGSDPIEYVNPYVATISLPHKNFVPVDFLAPNILIGLETGTENADEHAISIRIVCTTYGGNIPLGAEGLPDETGYIDLLNLIERIKSKLTQKAVIEKAGMIEKDFKYGIYDEEITYPYWYGYLQFTMQIPIENRQMIEDFI